MTRLIPIDAYIHVACILSSPLLALERYFYRFKVVGFGNLHLIYNFFNLLNSTAFQCFYIEIIYLPKAGYFTIHVWVKYCVPYMVQDAYGVWTIIEKVVQ